MRISLDAGEVPFLSGEEDPPVVGIIGETSLFPGLDFPATLTDASFKAELTCSSVNISDGLELSAMLPSADDMFLKKKCVDKSKWSNITMLYVHGESIFSTLNSILRSEIFQVFIKKYLQFALI